MNITKQVEVCIQAMYQLIQEKQHAYSTPEHFVYVLCEQPFFEQALRACDTDPQQVRNRLETYFENYIEKIEGGDPIESFALQQLFGIASHQAVSSGNATLKVQHLVAALFQLQESFAAYYLLEQGMTKTDLMYELAHGMDTEDANETFSEAEKGVNEAIDETDNIGEVGLPDYVTNLNAYCLAHPQTIVERHELINRTLEVLCRKQKNNPIHLGESGVGKTTLVLSLAERLNTGEVPTLLKEGTLFSLDLGGMLAGTQYRGDFEKRIKKAFKQISTYKTPIVYIDEIHTIVGAGALGNGAMDASSLLKPYLTEGKIRFIGATTYESYRKYVEKDKSLVRRFQTIEVKEPTEDECLAILKGLKTTYERYHNVTYTDGALESAVRLSHQYMNERFLPDKAIDLIDEAGVYMTMYHEHTKKRLVTPKIIEMMLSKMCQIPQKTIAIDEIKQLKTLEKTLKKSIFGQDHAIQSVVSAVKLSRSGLQEGTQPIASMLFVGPTGVGKTELAKTLAEVLGIKLLRFDMSEYSEKHTASKLIGSPPGYVGYEEGGLLTDAVRQTPHAVLLLDEIEKAHPDVFNMLLQVMDYATLTDSQGRKTDFRNCILLMTSNAGASEIGKALVGFGERKKNTEAMDEAVKKLFTPEFRNRLTEIVAFNPLEEAMLVQIIRKELKLLGKQLEAKAVNFTYSKQVIDYIIKKTQTHLFGAREVKRIVQKEIKPLLVDTLLFGDLTTGGEAKLTLEKDSIVLKAIKK